jgi:hypothetical protein
MIYVLGDFLRQIVLHARELDVVPDYAHGAFPGLSVSASASITCLHS